MTELLPQLSGAALVKHMETRHGYTTWCPPKPNTREYKVWRRQHAEEAHGCWADQQDHTHRGTP